MSRQMDHEAGTGVLLTQAGGHDAHHPLMPAAVGQYKGVPFLGRHFLDHGDGLGVDLLLHGLALAVELAQLAGQLPGQNRVLAQHQLCRAICLAHASGSIDAGSQHITDLHRGDLLLIKTGLLQQGLQTDEIIVGDMGKPAGHNGAVFSGHTHDIRHCPHGSQGAVSGEQLLRPVLSSQSQHQLQCNAAAGQMLEGIGAVGSMGVYHRYRPGQLILAFVVIRHHHIHAQRGGEIHFLHPGNTTVHGDDQCNALPAQGAHSVRGQAVAVLNAAGNIVTHLCAAAAQIVHKNGCGGNAVHIIIAEDGHMFSCVQRGADAGHGTVHVLHQQRG